MCSLHRFRQIHAPHEGWSGRLYGKMFKGEDHVCDESVQEECHDRDAIESKADVVGERFSSNTMSSSCLSLDSAYRWCDTWNNASTLELSARKADHVLPQMSRP
jgi:hypothetical protein